MIPSLTSIRNPHDGHVPAPVSRSCKLAPPAKQDGQRSLSVDREKLPGTASGLRAGSEAAIVHLLTKTNKRWSPTARSTGQRQTTRSENRSILIILGKDFATPSM